MATEESVPSRIARRVRVDEGTGCWMWTGRPQPTGYARITVACRSLFVHRWMHENVNGPIPIGYTVDHTCHNADASCPGGPCAHRRCVNPAHLEAVPRGVNVMRGRTIVAENAAKTTCPVGHAYDGISRSGSTGKRRRVCRTCRNAQQLAYTARKAAQ